MIKSIKNLIKRKLPEPIKKPLIRIYNKWNSRIILDKNLVKDLAEYFNYTYDETICAIKLGSKLNEALWNVLNPKTENEVKKFYEIVPFYPFDLAYWHMQKDYGKFRNVVLKICKGDVLDYGGGMGDLSLAIAEKGWNVIYADIYGKTFEFARWLFKKRGYPDIPVLDVEKDQKKIWGSMYDVIMCIDVIEHILHPEVILEKMAKHLRKNGKLIVTALRSAGETKDHPMHLKVNFDAENLLNSFGVFKSDIYDWLWIKNLKP